MPALTIENYKECYKCKLELGCCSRSTINCPGDGRCHTERGEYGIAKIYEPNVKDGITQYKKHTCQHKCKLIPCPLCKREVTQQQLTHYGYYYVGMDQPIPRCHDCLNYPGIYEGTYKGTLKKSELESICPI